WFHTYLAADLPLPQLVMAASLGEVFNALGHIDDAIALFDRAWQFAEAHSMLTLGPRVLGLLGDAYGRARRCGEAIATGERALALALQLGQRGDEARTLYLLGNIQGHGEPANVNGVRERYHKAMALARELRMRPLQAQCHFALGQLAWNTGHREEAQRHLNV